MNSESGTILGLALLICSLIALAITFNMDEGTPTVSRQYDYAAPTIKWTKQGGVHCEGWSLVNGQWFYRCDDSKYGVVNHGSLFTDLQSSP